MTPRAGPHCHGAAVGATPLINHLGQPVVTALSLPSSHTQGPGRHLQGQLRGWGGPAAGHPSPLGRPSRSWRPVTEAAGLRRKREKRRKL